MAIITERKQARSLYIPWLQDLVDFGEDVEVRGKQTKEILNAISVVTEPWHHCILLPSRRWNPWLAMSEFLWILAGRNDVAALEPYNQRIGDFSDDGVRLYGAYGARIYDQIDDLIERLRRDPSDRRAVLQIWDNSGYVTEDGLMVHRDLTVNSKDPPCNNLVYFKLRHEKLFMTVICRSNDLHWGLFAVNLPTFGLLQSYIAARLEVDMGTQTHISNSLHIYTDEPAAVAITERMLYNESDDMPVYPEHQKAFYAGEYMGKTHDIYAAVASSVLNGEPIPSAQHIPLFFHFANAFLGMYKSHDFTRPEAFPEFSDWIAAGKLFGKNVWQ